MHGPNFTRPTPELIDGEEEYSVEKILDSRRFGRRRRLQYLVKWEGYPDSDNMWVNKDDVFCYGRSTVVSNLDVEGFVLNVNGGSWQELDYDEVRTTERWINTQGESACQALKRKGRQGLYKVCQCKRDEVQGLNKVCTERMYRGCCRGSTKYTTRTE
jgi:hypothetical protein